VYGVCNLSVVHTFSTSVRRARVMLRFHHASRARTGLGRRAQALHDSAAGVCVCDLRFQLLRCSTARRCADAPEQSQERPKAGERMRYTGMVQTLGAIAREEGARNLWKGFTPCEWQFRNCFSHPFPVCHACWWRPLASARSAHVVCARDASRNERGA
jgi:hypothetical protein